MSVKIIAEIGINHDGSLEKALKLCEKAAFAEADYVKFQARTPELCVPREQWDVPKVTPWGDVMPYIEYRRKMEFGEKEWGAIAQKCHYLGIGWSVSVWDAVAVRRMVTHKLPWLKIPSAKLTDNALLRQAAMSNPNLILSTGMSTWQEVLGAVSLVGENILAIMHCHSAYPCPEEEVDLRVIERLAGLGWPVGYSGHEFGLDPSIASIHYGATWIERHITLDKKSKGSDHAASLEPDTFYKLVKHIRSAEQQIGTGEKRLWPSELPARKKLRGSA